LNALSQGEGLNALSEALTRHRAAGLPLCDLTVSNPTAVGLEYSVPGDLGAPENLFPYRPEPLGEFEAREAVAAYLQSQGQYGRADRIGLASGTSEAYAFLFKLLARPGEEVMTLTPGYPLCDALIEWAGLKQATFAVQPLEASKRASGQDHAPVNWTKLEQSLSTQTRALILIHPNNPTGRYFTADDWQAVMRLAQDHDLALIVDTVFFDYVHQGMQGLAPVPRSNGPLVITLGGLSKTCGLPQLKLAWVSFDGSEAKVAAALERWEWMADLFLSVSTPVQRLAPRLLAERRHFQQALQNRMAQNLTAAAEALQGSTVRPLWPQGGWSLPLQILGCDNDEGACLDLLSQHHTLTQPGYFFDYAEEGILVISLITPPEIFQRGLAAIRQLAATF
jgi:alanine-synthesizing transaminase